MLNNPSSLQDNLKGHIEASFLHHYCRKPFYDYPGRTTWSTYSARRVLDFWLQQGEFRYYSNLLLLAIIPFLSPDPSHSVAHGDLGVWIVQVEGITLTLSSAYQLPTIIS